MSINYNEKLKEKYQNLPEIRRIARSRKVPKSISKASTLKRTMTESVKRKENNRRLHGKEEIKSKPARKAIVLAQEE